MVFWDSWNQTGKFLFVFACIIVVVILLSAIARYFIKRDDQALRARLEDRERIRLAELRQQPESERELPRRQSVNFGIKALDGNETPADANIVDSESLRTATVTHNRRYLRPPSGQPGVRHTHASPASSSAGGSAPGSSLRPPPSRYVRPPARNLQPRGRSPNPGQHGNVTQGSSLAEEEEEDQTPVELPGSEPPVGGRSYVPSTGRQYLEVSTHSRSRPLSASSANRLRSPPNPDVRPVKGILKNREAGQTPPLATSRNSYASSSAGVSPPSYYKDTGSNDKRPLGHTGMARINPTSARSRYSSTPSDYDDEASTSSPQPVGGSGNVKDLPSGTSSVKLPENAHSLAIPQPTRAAPPIPFLNIRSPVPAEPAEGIETVVENSDKQQSGRADGTP